MGTMIELNDTLRISKKQGFPEILDVEKHIQNPFSLEDVENKIFTFSGKSKIRNFQAPPIRTFLVEDLGGKWLYWGLCHILSININYETQETSGTYKIIRLNTPEEMKQMFNVMHYNKPEENYFKEEK